VTAPTRLSTTDIPNGPTASPRVPSLAIRAADLLASEWTKFRSVRSTYWTLLVALLTPIAFSALVAFAFANAPAKAGPPPDPLLPEVLSLEYAVIAVSVLGVLSAGVLDALAAAALGPAEDLAGRDEDPAVLAGRPAQPGLS
jgi:hypothetical protein